MNEFIEKIKDYIYWHYIFPYLNYTKKHFDKKRVANGVLFIRKKESADAIFKKLGEGAK